MNDCPLCRGTLVRKTSRAGAEVYCGDCRNVIESATLHFSYKEEAAAVEACQGPANDPRPGFKGPGDKAKCWLYDDGNDEQKKYAHGKASASAHANSRKAHVSHLLNYAPEGTIVLSSGGFDTSGTPSMVIPKASTTGAEAVTQAAGGATPANPPASAPDLSSKSQMAPATADSAGPVAKPTGTAPGVTPTQGPSTGDGSGGPMGTLSSRRLAELVQELDPVMGRPFCTEHNEYDNCVKTI